MDDMDLPTSVDVWPENFGPARVFESMGTQWRVGAGGVTGLDYQALQWVFKLLGVEPDDEEDVFYCVRVMESEAMVVMREK